eukprot:4722935-Pleurochrysis_carterae.AAC.2
MLLKSLRADDLLQNLVDRLTAGLGHACTQSATLDHVDKQSATHDHVHTQARSGTRTCTWPRSGERLGTESGIREDATLLTY